MAMLDLQKLPVPAAKREGERNRNSGASKGCNNSVLSLLLC